METNKILSIVIPTYNAEQFLDKGLPTFIMDDKDLLDKLEVLVIVDGSPDDSAKVAQKYVDQYPNVFKVIEKENGGHGSGINVGSKLATGKYFKVIDADDWVDTEVLVRLMKLLENEDCDAIISSYITYDISKDEYEDRRVSMDDMDKYYNLRDILNNWDNMHLGMSFHGVTYNTKFYLDQKYDLVEKAFYEDQEFATIPLCRATKIKVVDDPLYIYRIGDVNQSVSTASQLRRLPDFEKVLFKMMEFEAHLDELPEGGADYWTRKVSKFIADIYQITLVKNTDKKGQRKYIKDLNRRINEKSPRVFAFVKNKYRVFVILNRFHMSDETYNGGFTRLLAWARKHLHVDKLYG